jgi:hypothetical protein
MDSALPHMLECILPILDENNIIALTVLDHTTNLFQTLDLVLFDSLKHLKATTVGEFGDDSVNNHLTMLIQVDEQISTSSTIMRSFRRAGMTQNTTTRPYMMMVDKVTMRESPSLQVIWEENLSIDDLFRRRQMQRSDIINSEFLPTCLNYHLPDVAFCFTLQISTNPVHFENTKVALHLSRIEFS